VAELTYNNSSTLNIFHEQPRLRARLMKALILYLEL